MTKTPIETEGGSHDNPLNLNCPVCGESYLHLEKILEYRNQDILRLRFSCELCDSDGDDMREHILEINQHEGVERIYWKE